MVKKLRKILSPPIDKWDNISPEMATRIVKKVMCPDCRGTGLIETETIKFGKPYWKDGRVVCDITGKGDWMKTQCPCVGEDE